MSSEKEGADDVHNGMRNLTSSACMLLPVSAACGDSHGKTSPEQPALVLTEISSVRLAGRRGNVEFEVDATGDKGARATFRLLGVAGANTANAVSSAEMKWASATEPGEVEIVLHDETRAELRYAGVTFDGAGALSDAEARALEALATSRLYAEVPLIGLDTPCATTKRIEPRLMAALLVPFQAALKYRSADRSADIEAWVRDASCRYFTRTDRDPDLRRAPVLPLLSNGQVVPMAFGYLPFDAEGERSTEAAGGRAKLKVDSNVYGPGQSMCRGACGADCEPNNCGEPQEVYRCVQENGRNTGDKERWQIYTCGEHEGCITHDACFDDCNASFGVGSWDAAFCMRACDLQAAASHGALQGLECALGNGPFSHEKSYEYATGERVRDEKACPLNFGLSVTPNSGITPLTSTIRWEFDVNESSAERCRLDLGDGSAPVTLDPCPARGEHEHTFRIPSEMREKSGVYHVTMTRIGTDQRITTDVQANYRFLATPSRGKAPLATQLSWEGFSAVEKPLTCSVSFGDGSAPVEVQNCQRNATLMHEYAERGVYTATLTVRGGDRVLSKAIVIEVRDEEELGDCGVLNEASRFTASASFSYAVSASNDWESIDHQASATLHSTLEFAGQGGDGISFVAKPTGTIMYSERTDLNGKLLVHEQGAGAPLPDGSQILLNVNRRECSFNIHVQASVAGTRQWGDDVVEQAEHFVGTFNSQHIPFPSGMSASFSGSYPAHSFLESPELTAFYYVDNYQIVSMLGEDGLGTAQISWQIALEE